MDARTTSEAYLATWNETDAQRRQAVLARHWTANACYADPLMQGVGHGEIGGLVSAVHARFPGFRFQLLGQPDGHGEHVRLRWALGPEGAQAPIEGSDYIRLKEGRIAEVIGFLDRVPSA